MPRSRNLILLFLVCFSQLIAVRASAQQALLDTLFTVWQDESRSDSIRITAFGYYIWDGFHFSKPDSALVLVGELIDYSRSKGNLYGEALGLNIQGSIYNLKGDYIRTLYDYQQSLKIYEELGNKRGISNQLSQIGFLLMKQGDNTRALDYIQRSLVIREELGNKSKISNSLKYIGSIYHDLENYPRALEYYQRSLALKEEIGDKRYLTDLLISIGRIYQGEENDEQALAYFNRALRVNEEREDRPGIASALTSIGYVYASQGDDEKALEYYQRSLQIRMEMEEKLGIANSLIIIGNIYRKQDRFARAIDFCSRGDQLAREIQVLQEQSAACQCLYDTYKEMGNGDQALLYIEKVQSIEDSLHNQQAAQKLQLFEFQREVLQDSIARAEEARQKEEEFQAALDVQKRNRNIAFMSGGIFLLLAGGFYSRFRYVRRSKVIIEKERDRSESLILNILPAEIAKELKEKGSAAARDFENVSVLFSDFKGFTEISETLDAAALVREINSCFEAFDAIMEKYGIEKIKTIGDAYMAVGGLPVPHDDAVEHTVLAALEMQAFIKRRAGENKAQGKPAFEMRVGIHTGPVVAGIVGVKKFQYDIWGDTVNTANRMESHGAIGKVNISSSTYAAIQHDPQFKFEVRENVTVKGKGEMLMYFVDRSGS